MAVCPRNLTFANNLQAVISVQRYTRILINMKNIRHGLPVLFFISFMLNNAAAQNTLSATDSTRNLKKLHLLGLPAISYSPETRIVFGVGGFAVFRLGSDVLHTSPSQVNVALAYTQNKQQIYTTTFQVYTNKNKYNIYGEAGYYKYNYNYYGIGTHEIPKEQYSANYPRIKVSVLHKWAPHYFAGIRYQYENYQMASTLPGGELATGTIPGSTGSISSGAGIVQILDRRDTVLYPTKGFWMELALLYNTKSLGSTSNYGQYSYDVTYYKRIYKNIVWANELYTKYIDGNAPFEQYAFLGGNKKLRGFYEGRYRDKHTLIVQTEFRALVYKSIGVTVFGGAGFLGGDGEYVRFNLPKFAFGGGLRYVLNKSDHLNLRLDYALSSFSNITGGYVYATFGEAF